MHNINYIQGDKFMELANFVYTPEVRSQDDYGKSVNTLNLNRVKNGDIIYTHTIYVKQLFEVLNLISGRVTVVSHNGDVNIDNSFEIPNSVEKWYSQNVNLVNPKIESIPIGMENNRWCTWVHKKEKIEAKLKTPRNLKGLAYMNHNIKTNPIERRKPYELLTNKSWVLAQSGINGKGYDEYIDNIYNHQFVICPQGNGMDTHRTWETLYLGSIPIEKRNINNQFYTDLPICFVDDWEEVTEEYLERWLLGSSWQEWNMKKLTFEYWKNKIQESCK